MEREVSMSISLDGSMLNINSGANNFNADKVQNTLNGVNKKSSEDELMEVCKDFSSYFIEEVIKEIKENMTLKDEDEDASMSTLTDFHMDGVIEEISDTMLDQTGNSFVQQLYEQMKRNYGLE